MCCGICAVVYVLWYVVYVMCVVCCVLCVVCCVLCVVCYTICYAVLCIVYYVWCVVCGVWCVVCGVWCVLCSVCYMLCSVLCCMLAVSPAEEVTHHQLTDSNHHPAQQRQTEVVNLHMKTISTIFSPITFALHADHYLRQRCTISDGAEKRGEGRGESRSLSIQSPAFLCHPLLNETLVIRSST